MNERDMLDLLLRRYNTQRRGAIADRWVRAEHVRSTQGWATTRVADFVAVDKWSSSQAIHGHEVKVSRSDWLTELRDLTKSEAIKRYCNHWWLVVPSASIVKPGELPVDWGLIVTAGDGLRVRTHAPALQPEPLTLDFVAGLTAAAARTASREPLHRDAVSIPLYKRGRGYYSLCQACGGEAPCVLHQPRLLEGIAA